LVATVLVALVFADAASDREKERQNRFTVWMRKHDKKYTSDEFQQRYRNWKSKDDEINTQNLDTQDYFIEHNRFSDLTQDEFETYFTGAKLPQDARLSEEDIAEARRSAEKRTLYFGGATLDYRSITNPIQDQGQCGSCWAFSTAAAIEGYWAKTGHGIKKVSEQQIVDCVTSCSGCNGGWPYNAIDWVRQHGWISTKASYPYTSGSTHTAGHCHDATDSTVRVHGAQARNGNPSTLKSILDQTGPVSVAVDASRWGSYGGGVFSCPSQSPGINHAVTAVGYGHDGSGNEYWLIRNSWNTWWGEQGYMRLKANGGYGQDCGVLNYIHSAY